MNKAIRKTKFSCTRGMLTLRGYEYRRGDDRLPIAIVSHGFMANLHTVKHYARMLAELGYAAFCFDFAGGCVLMGRSDGKTTEMSVMTEVEDLKAVIEYAKALPYTDSDKILLMGCSQGGLVSAITAAELGESVSTLVLLYPALSIPDDARRGKMMMAKFDPENIPNRLRCGPMRLGSRYVRDVIGVNSFEIIRNYPGDVLIIHGDKDGIVNISYSDEAKRVYLAEPYERRVVYLKIKGAHHMFSGRHDRLAIERIIKFLK